MKKRIEIEAKFELLNDKQLLEKLEKNSEAKLVEENEIQKDTYFTPNDRNFLDKRPVSEHSMQPLSKSQWYSLQTQKKENIVLHIRIGQKKMEKMLNLNVEKLKQMLMI